MDVHSSKRGVATSKPHRKGYNISSRDAKYDQDQNAHYCNRIGCNGRIKYVNQNTKPGTSEKAKSSSSKPSLCSSNRSGVIEASSRSASMLMNKEKSSSSLDSKRKLSSQSESSQSDDSEAISSPTSHLSASTKTGSVSFPSSVRSRKKVNYTSGSSKQYTQTVSPAPKTSGLATLKCNSRSDASPPSCSSSSSKPPTRDMMKKRSLGGESSVASRGSQTTTAGRISSSSGPVSRHSSCVDSRMRLSYRQIGRNTPCFTESEPPRSVGQPRLPHRFSANPPLSGSSSYSLSSSNDENGYSHLVNHNSFQPYDMDRIAEVLLALERIQQDGEMTHAQILALETSLLLSGLNLYDEHRDMRLDIDDMSYEELLALGDRMGTVSTALSEEELLKCAKRSIYPIAPPELVFKDGDDVKCSICQEEYVEGDEIAELVECQHAYHVPCVNQWLRLKNWCPICKTAAATPHSSSSSSSSSS